ncbi:MAG: hypothetical protein IJV10_02155 [Prevotella sp.]|nr:hypothetical protein [Prevotella sp.]
MKKNILIAIHLLVFVFTSICVSSCGDSDDDGVKVVNSTLVGTWVSESSTQTETIVFGNDGSYKLTLYTPSDNDTYTEKGNYSYNQTMKILVKNCTYRSNSFGSYSTTLIVQTLNATTLVLIHDDGDVFGYFKRKK